PPISLFTLPPPPHISPLSLHDALPISLRARIAFVIVLPSRCTNRSDRVPRFYPRLGAPVKNPPTFPFRSRPLRAPGRTERPGSEDRKSTRLNSSHVSISYAVFCLKKKK